MKIMIAGSVPDLADSENFKSICACLASSLVQPENEFVLGSDRETTADCQFFNCLLAGKGSGNVKIFYHEDKSAPFQGNAGNKKVSIEYERVEGGWESGRVPQIMYSDIIILLGGGDKTNKIASLARYLKKPVIPIPCIEGAAKDVWKTMSNEVYTSPPNVKNLWNKIETWDNSNSGNAIKDLVKLTTAKKSRNFNWSFLLFVFGIFLSLFGWVYCFDVNKTISPIARLFVSLGCAAFLGSSLHYLINFLANEERSIDYYELLARAIAGFIVGFSLFLIYMVGGGVIVGDQTFLEKIKTDTDFKRVVALMSVVGIFSGFMLENSVEKLKTALVKQVKRGK